jgi:uncharacterized protein YbaR (Trm112 family)
MFFPPRSAARRGIGGSARSPEKLGAAHENMAAGQRIASLDTRLLEILACPICKGTLKFQRDAQVLVCRMDRLAYPIRDDVPVMLEEEARQLSADDPLLER